MPTQSRGFYICDFCGLVCDTPEEAKEHEVHCPKRAGQQNAATAPPPSATPAHPGRFPPPGAMPPSHPPHYLPMPPQEMEYPPSMMHPMAMNPKEKCIVLLGPHERTQLSVEDAIACQNIELFEVTAEELPEFTRNGVNVVAKQLGVRCIHSGRIAATLAQSTLFPDSLGDVAKCVRKIADTHLSVNERVPPEVREACKRAASKRGEQQGEEGNDNTDQMASLVTYCVELCNRLRVVNKQPHKTGIEFSMGPEMGQYPYPMGTPMAPGRGGMPGPGPYSADRYPPMMGMDRMGYRTPLPHMVRGGPPPSAMMGGPQGPEGARNREGAPPAGMYPGEREGAPPNQPAGYPPQYAPGQGPPPQGGPNASQANFEGQEQGPVPAPRQDGSPPAGYSEYDLPPHFPYYQERDRTWHCKYCSHVPPQYREPHSIWSSPNGSPPPGSFIDEHLSMCRAYHQTMSSQHMYQGASYGPSVFGPQASMYGPPPGPWDGPYPPQPGMPYPGMPPDGRYPEEAYADPRVGPPGSRGPPRAASGPPSRASAPPALPRSENSADTIQLCVNHLVGKEREYYAKDPENAKIPRLVLDDDKLLLTDYFFYLMKQLRLCRFSESDRKTRGGKREKIKIGYGGLQCVHCADVANSRKFFWSNVDRLANSFAEIPGHVLKCRRCPQQTKEALMSLKAFHPEQMARLPRGSQKVFFRRMWRRLHDEDPGQVISASASNEENMTPEKAMDSPESKGSDTKREQSSPGSPKNDDSIVPILPTKEAAEILAKSLEQKKDSEPLPKILLAVSDDKNWLSDMDCFIRKQIEVFCATEEDVAQARSDRKYPVKVGQVGIRCIHCSTSEGGAIGQAVSYPFSISGIYESVREFQRLHLDSCEHVTEETKLRLATFKGSSSLSSVLRKYYVSAARALGLQDSSEGIRAGGESVPITSQGAFNTESQSTPKTKSEDDQAKTSETESESSKKAPGPSEKDAKEAGTKEPEKDAAERKESDEKDTSPTTTPADSKDKATEKQESAPESNEAEEEVPESRSDSPVSSTSSGKKRASPTSEDADRPSKLAKIDAPVEMKDVAIDAAKSPRKSSE